MPHNRKGFFDVLIPCIIIAVILFGTYISGFKDGVQSTRKEAVKLSLAKYIPDANGEASFTWIIQIASAAEKIK